MTDQPKQTGVVSAVPTIARDVMPEGRLKTDVSVSHAFADAGEISAEGKDSASAGGSGDPQRFADIKAECRYCGRSFEKDHSL